MTTIDFKAQADAMRDELITRRRDFHMHPELAFEEVRTAGIVAQELGALGLEVQVGVGKSIGGSKHVSKALAGHFKNLGTFAYTTEFRTDDLEGMEVGKKLDASGFQVGELVTVPPRRRAAGRPRRVPAAWATSARTATARRSRSRCTLRSWATSSVSAGVANRALE